MLRNTLVRGLGMAIVAVALFGGRSSGGVIWDGDNGVVNPGDNNIDVSLNWDDDTTPDLTSAFSDLVFGTGGVSVRINVPVSVNSITLNRAANFAVVHQDETIGSLTVGAGGIIADAPTSSNRIYYLMEAITANGAQTWETMDQYSRLQVDRDVILSNGDLTLKTIDHAGGMITVTGNSVISGDQGLHLLGRVTLQGVNTYTGNTTIGINGNLTIANDQAIPNGAGKGNVVMDNSDNLVNDAGVLNINNRDVNINALIGANGFQPARVLNNVASGGQPKELIVGHGDASGNFFGSILDRTSGAGTVWLTKVGDGTQTLSGVNEYTGKTRINGGTLALSGAGSIGNSSAIEIGLGATLDVSATSFTLANGQTLAGNGTVTGNVTAAAGSNVAAGLGVGSLAVSGDLELSDDAKMTWELGSLGTDNPGIAFDQLVVGGDLDISNSFLGVTLELNFDLLAEELQPDHATPSSFWTLYRRWKIIDTATNTGATNFGLLVNGAFDAGTFSTSIGAGADAGDIFLDFVTLLPPMQVPGDANKDGQVDDLDAKKLAANWGVTFGAGWEDGDFNGDSAVDALDAAILAANWGYSSAAESTAVPEPGVIVLLLAAAFVAARKRIRR